MGRGTAPDLRFLHLETIISRVEAVSIHGDFCSVKY